MAPAQRRKSEKSQFQNDDSSENSGGNSSDGAMSIDEPDDAGSVAEKSETEEELERLVFGDSAGFERGLRNFVREIDRTGTRPIDTAEDSDSDLDQDGALDNMADADVLLPSALTYRAV